jgi:DUF4097 and DUF4098 domain-containing protein YvlB
MKSMILGVLVLALSVIVVLSGARSNHSVTLASSDDAMGDDCSEHMQDYGRHYESVVREEESRSLPNQPLNINAEHNGGISISTWDRPDFSVKLCKQVSSESDAQGKRILAETRLEINGGTVSVSSPDQNEDYNLNALILVKAPRGAQVNMKVKNGGIALHRFTGTAEAKATNGGISFKQSNGKLTAHAQNGGISIQDCGGEVTADVQNGGLSIKLPQQWDGKGLEAHTQNGGLVIQIPRNFSSGLEVTASDHVSIICKGDACDQAQRTWDNGHRMLRLGNGEPQIRATTVNGGIVIEDRERSRETI